MISEPVTFIRNVPGADDLLQAIQCSLTSGSEASELGRSPRTEWDEYGLKGSYDFSSPSAFSWKPKSFFGWICVQVVLLLTSHSHVTHTGAVLTQCSLWEPQIYHYQIYKYQFITFLLALTSHCQSITEQSPQPRLMWEYFQRLPVIAALLGNLLKFWF